jgi:excinuclease UvrABC ATPase subunit
MDAVKSGNVRDNLQRKNIADVLAMTVDEAVNFFRAVPPSTKPA